MQFFKTPFVAAFIFTFSQLANAQFFIISCQPLTVQRSDPIVDPGAVSGHTHAIIGGTAFQRSMGPDTAKNARATTCEKPIDKSNYWQPHLYHQRSDGKFELVTFQGSLVYYLNRVCDYAPGRTSCDLSKHARAPPAGLRIFAGDPNLRTYNHANFAHRAISHACLKSHPVPETPNLPRESCEVIRSQVFLPSCWNGRDLDSADHKSHMSYPNPAYGDYNGGVCPQSHPIAILSIFFEFFYDTKPFPDWQNLVYANGDKTGLGLHGDFINGWTDQNALQNALATCTGPQGSSASGCTLNGGKPATGPSIQPLDVPAPYEPEPLGLNGPVSKLPGNNPVSKREFVSRIVARKD